MKRDIITPAKRHVFFSRDVDIRQTAPITPDRQTVFTWYQSDGLAIGVGNKELGLYSLHAPDSSEPLRPKAERIAVINHRNDLSRQDAYFELCETAMEHAATSKERRFIGKFMHFEERRHEEALRLWEDDLVKPDLHDRYWQTVPILLPSIEMSIKRRLFTVFTSDTLGSHAVQDGVTYTGDSYTIHLSHFGLVTINNDQGHWKILGPSRPAFRSLDQADTW